MILASTAQGLGRVLRALRRSRVKRDVLYYLCSIYPESAYPALIADAVGASYENVVGALRGLGERYRREDSLLGLGLVEEVSIGRAKFYRVRDGAVEIGRSLTRHEG